MLYEIFTDGATSGNGKKDAKGGWAFMINEIDGTNKDWIVSGSGHEFNTTNNRMELTAIIEGLTAVQHLIDNFSTVTIYSDSAYCINAVKQCWYISWQNNGWRNSKKEPVKNRDLWEQLIPYFEDSRYFFEKVQGHSGVEENEIVDRLAKEAIKEK